MQSWEIDYDSLDDIKLEQMNDAAFVRLGHEYVGGEGDNPIAFVIGEAPGAHEQIRKRPFIGPSGQIMRQLLSLASLWATDPEDAYTAVNGPTTVLTNCWLTNVVKFRPPGNRNPSLEEIAAARPYIFREWLAVGSPRLIIPVGSIALRAITNGRQVSILRVSGQLQKTIGKDGVLLYIWPMIHPRFGISNPSAQAQIERDWIKLGEWIDDNDMR